MRAVRYHEHGGPDVLQIDEVDRPTPAPDKVLIEMRAASVNAVDTRFRAGTHGSVSLPGIPGGDGAGVVADVGENVDEFTVGDRVFAGGMGHDDGGTFVEYAAVPAMKVAHLPESIPFEVGGALPNVGVTAWRVFVDVAALKPTEYCLVHGGNGGVGHVAVQLATAMGADVIATARSEEIRDQVESLGAVATLDYESETLAEEINDVTAGNGVDVVLDHRLDDYLGVDLAVAAQNARIITITGSIPEVEAGPLQAKEPTIHGMAIANTPNRRPILRRLSRLVVRGDVTASVAATYDLEAAGEAHQAAVEEGYLGKIIVTPQA